MPRRLTSPRPARTGSPSACGPSAGRASTSSAARCARRWTRPTRSTGSPTSAPTASPSTTTTSSPSTPTPPRRRRHLGPLRKALDETGLGRADGHDEPVLPPGLPRRRLHQQRPRRTPVRPPQGGGQHRPGGRARAPRSFVAWGGREGAESGASQGHPGRAGPLQGGLRPARASTSSTRATTSGSRSSPSPTSRAATSCCRRSATRSPSSTSSSTPSWSASTPRSGTRRWPGGRAASR